jgi:hypothetical protein
MLEHLRIIDDELFLLLERASEYLTRSTHLLELLLAGDREGELSLARAIHLTDHEAHQVAWEADVRAFKSFIMRVDRMDVHALAASLDAAIDAVEHAGSQAAALHASGAPEQLRDLARILTLAAEGVRTAIPHLGRSRSETTVLTAEVRWLKDRGDDSYYAGVEQLFAGDPDAVQVLRWKDIYDKVRNALGCCSRAAGAIEQVAQNNA